MRILPKSLTLVFALLAAACTSMVPWRNEPLRDEVNLGFTLENNLVTLSTVTIDGRAGRFILGSAVQRTVLDPAFVNPRRTHALQLTKKETLALASPNAISLGGVADAIIGADAWRGRAITINYHTGLVTYQKQGIHPGEMTLYHYTGEPMIEVTVGGAKMNAIVDTSSPDTLVLPAAQSSRGNVSVQIAGNDFGTVDVRYANVARARVGNRLLSRFLVTIDYGQRLVGLWFDPRNAGDASTRADSGSTVADDGSESADNGSVVFQRVC